MKISITPEMQIPMAIIFGVYFFRSETSYRPPLWIFPLVFLGCLLSLLRENLIVFGLLTILCLFRRYRFSRWIFGSVGSVALLMIIINNLPEISLLLNAILNTQTLGFIDTSIMQRFIEIKFCRNQTVK